MPVGAILGGVGLVGTVLSSRNNSAAIKDATQAQTDSNAQSVALQREVYGQNRETLNPYVQRGNVAGNAINDMLGLGGTAQTTQQPALNLATQRGGPGVANYYGVGDGSIFGDFSRAELNDMYPQVGTNTRQNAFGGGYGGLANGYAGGTYNGSQQVTPPQQGQPQAVNGNDAFQTWLSNSNYAFDFDNGSNAINSGYAGAGTLQSGAAMKGLEDYRQNLQNGYRGEFMGYLGQQQGTGLQAAGAQAGVGVNYANSVSGLNQQNANALSNAAVAKANNSNSLIGGIAGGVGSILGGGGR